MRIKLFGWLLAFIVGGTFWALLIVAVVKCAHSD